MKHLSYSPALPILCLLVSVGSIVGCSASFTSQTGAPAPAPLGGGNGDVRGGAYGGRQPILGAHIYLYGASKSGYSVPTGTTSPTPISGISLLGNTVGGCVAADHLYADSNGNCYYLTGTGTDPDTPANTADQPGFFNLTGLYQCNVSSTSASPGSLPYQQVWLYSIGGDPGVGLPSSGSAPNNPAASLTAALGTCNQTTNNFSTLPFIFMNEVSTVAFAYAVAPFAYDATHISADSTNYTNGLANAFLNASQLYDIGGGVDPGDHSGARYNTPNGYGAVPTVLINSIADVLANCINSNNVSTTDPSGESTPCTDLFTLYTTGSPTPSETASAAISIAKHPGYVSYGITGYPHIFDGLNSYEPWHPAYNDSSPYTNPNNSVTTAVPAEPYDLTAAILFSGPAIAEPTGIVAGPLGNVFIGMDAGNTFTKFSSTGTPTSSFTAPGVNTLTIDIHGNLWGVSGTDGNLLEITNTSASQSSGSVVNCATMFTNCPTVGGNVNPYLTSGAISFTSGPPGMLIPLASDAIGAGSVYVGDAGNNQIVKVNSATGAVSATYTSTTSGVGACAFGVNGVALDQSGNLWAVGSNDICKIAPVPTTSGPNATKTLSGGNAYGVAIDHSGNGWIALNGLGGGSLLEVGANFASDKANTGGGLVTPSLVQSDGNSNIFVLNGYDASYNAADGQGAYPSLVEFAGRGVVLPAAAPSLSPTTYGFQYQQFSEPAGLAIDVSGNVWVSSGTITPGDPFQNTVTEIIGLAAPTAAPILNTAGDPEVKTGTEQQ